MDKVKHYYSMGTTKYYTQNQVTDCFQAMTKIEDSCVIVWLFNRPNSYVYYHKLHFAHRDNDPLKSVRKAHRFAYLWVLLNTKESTNV